MKPIDEMRKRVKRSALMNSIRDEMLAYIDAIEAEEMAERNVAYNEGYDEGFASADDWLAQHEDAMAEHGWVKLPLGADGEPLRVGDEIEYPNGARDTVRFATISPIGWAVNDRGWTPEAIRHHHHPPTVEDVLREFTDAILEWAGKSGTVAEVGFWSEVAAEYAAKLQLREE